MGCLGVILQQNNPVSCFPHQFLGNIGAVSSFPTQSDPALQFPTRLLSSFLPLSRIVAGFLKFIYNHTLSAEALPFLLPRERSLFSISSFSPGCPVCITATGLYLVFVPFLFFWNFSLF